MVTESDNKKVINIHMVEKQLFYAPLYIAVQEYYKKKDEYSKELDEKGIGGHKLPEVKLIDRNSPPSQKKIYYKRDSPYRGGKCILDLLDDLPKDNNSLNLVLTGDLDIYDYLKK